jgi:hypothetical protein
MPQLDSLVILFKFPVSSRDVERQFTHTPIMTPVTLPNLHLFRLTGVGAYLEALYRRITTPRLKKLEIEFYDQLTWSVPRLQQLMNTIEDLRFDNAQVGFFNKKVGVLVSPVGEVGTSCLAIAVQCWHLDWQISFAAQISTSLSQIFSLVEHLTLGHEEHTSSSEEHSEIDRTEPRKLLRSFSHMETLRVDDGLVKELARGLRLDDGELPLELLPELQEITYSGSGNTDDLFTSFIDARQIAGRPVTLVHL